MARYKTRTPLPKHLWKRNAEGRVICQCGKGYGSDFDGLCFQCRGGISGWEAEQQAKGK